MIRILAIGKKHESWVQTGIERYEKRLKKPFDAEWVLLPHSAQEGLLARQNESETILSRLDDRDFVIVLDETGESVDSRGLAALCERVFTGGQRVVMVIGGAYGVNDILRQRADFIWSLSPLVFPHQLVRLILVEQLYRAQEITHGHPYHHD